MRNLVLLLLFFIAGCRATGTTSGTARLTRTRTVQLAGKAAREYTYERKMPDGKRSWTEILTMTSVHGASFGVVAQIPSFEGEPYAEPLARGYLEVYDLLRESFRSTRPISTPKFSSPLGFRIGVPGGLPVYQGEDGITLRYPAAAQNDGFVVKECQGTTPESCLLDAEMPARLIRSTAAKLGPYPAKEYRFDRATASQTRMWTEVVTGAVVGKRTYSAIVQIPTRTVEAEYLEFYDRIRKSFQLTGRDP
jgi:hypothetical protein